MTTLTAGREAIYQRFVDNWSATPAVNVAFDSEKFKIPVGQPWVRLSVRHRDAQQESLGDVGMRKFTRIGSVIIQCFAPLDAGRRVLDGLAEAARTIFEGVHLTGPTIRFTESVVRELPPEEGWANTNVESFFEYTEHK